MDRMTRGYFNSGADGMSTINAFDRYKLRPRVLRDVTYIDPSTTFLGKKVPPTAMQRMAHPDGELATARAAAKRVGDVDYVLQLYVMKNRGTSEMFIRKAGNTSLKWEDIKWLRSITRMQIWLKGVLTEEDIMAWTVFLISNHGGRQLDSATSTLDALPESLALGADGMWVGRVPLWGLVYDGQAGGELALRILYEEFVLCMALAGYRNVGEGPGWMEGK
ncbi:FMN-linked oxidoreductase [Terfezia boudieri ATCC MYA-4762]|uniref:FMN-linked oxidoreductase n=1 Tax=Terfezia boudieri ATCC MYA-4762 TaxID=1051890 RepID=A0A3N4LGX3_9PEZI|nr:FMN-linked oxidoreductase [Terfezia boudieri ATCC MYA-4762]